MIWSFKTKGLPAVGLSIALPLLSAATTLCADTTVFAAASLRGVLDELSTLYDSPLTLSYAGSGTIARQVAQGAPADVVILAHPRWMDWLDRQNMIRTASRTTIAGNRLVVIAPSGSLPLEAPETLPERLGDNRMAMGQRDAVPAGIYARNWLETTGLWDKVQHSLAETDNVRAALAFVAQAETPIGIVYASDAQAEPRVDVLYNIPADTHPAITYPGASLNAQGDALLTWLRAPQAQAIFIKHGFSAP